MRMPAKGAVQVEAKPDPREQFAQALRDAGLRLQGAPLMDGQLHRVQVEGDHDKDRSGSYVGHLDGRPAGFYQNFKTGGEKVTWKASGRVTALSAQDRIEIAEILSFSSHLLDNRQWDMFGEVFVPGVRLSAPQGKFDGPAGVRRFVESVDLARFPATHTLNSIVEAVDEDTAVCWSRMLLLTWDRRVACGDYIDTFRRTADGWRIERRTVAPRNDSASAALAEGGGCVVGGTAWHVVAADVDPAWVREQTAHDPLAAPLGARFLTALAGQGISLSL